MSWIAQYEQHGKWNDMIFLSINVQTNPGGVINGKGKDKVGEFTFEGSFNANDLKCKIHKHYNGKHSVYYQGEFIPQTGDIKGSWGFKPGNSDGGFRMIRK